MINRFQERKGLVTGIALALTGGLLALVIGFGTSAQNQVLFSDNFEDGNASDWQRSGGSWSVVSDGSLVYRQSGTSADTRARAGSTAWTDYAVEARVKPLAFGGTGRYVALLARAVNVNHFYYLALQNGNQLVLAKRDGGTSTTLASASFTVSTGTFYTLRIEAQGTTLRGFVNGALRFTATDSQFSSGNAGVAMFYASGEFDDFVVTSLSGQTGQPPAAPAGLTAAPGNQQVALSWNASSGATSYSVKRSTASGGPYSVIGSTSATSFTNTGLANGTTYFFVVSAVNSAGESANSNQASATPAGSVTLPPAPAGLSAVAGDGQVSLGWNASPGATGYNVKRSTVSGGPYSTIATNVAATSFINTSLTNGTTYFFVVSAVNSAGQSANSNQVSATPVESPTGGDGDIFVAPNGSDSNPGTMEQPTTLQRAIMLIDAGGTIFMRGGTYNYSATITIARGNDGTSSQRKNIYAFGSERPILNFAAQAFASSNRGIQLNGHFWHLRGLEVMNAGDNGIFIGGNNNIIELCVTHNNRDSGLQLGRYASSAAQSEWPANNLILNCTSFDNFDPDNGEDADGFACKLTTGPGNVFRGCIAYNNIDDGWDLFTESSTGAIGTVTIENCIAYNNGFLSTGGTTTDSDGNGFKLGGSDIPVNHTVRRCISFNNKKHGFTYNSNPGSITMTNNTSWSNGESNFAFDEGTHIFTNNLSFQGTDSDDNSGTDVSNTNCWWMNGTSVNGKGLVVTAADFLSLVPNIVRNADGSINTGNFLRLAPGSDLINAGTPSGTDIGAVESQ